MVRLEQLRKRSASAATRRPMPAIRPDQKRQDPGAHKVALETSAPAEYARGPMVVPATGSLPTRRPRLEHGDGSSVSSPQLRTSIRSPRLTTSAPGQGTVVALVEPRVLRLIPACWPQTYRHDRVQATRKPLHAVTLGLIQVHRQVRAHAIRRQAPDASSVVALDETGPSRRVTERRLNGPAPGRPVAPAASWKARTNRGPERVPTDGARAFCQLQCLEACGALNHRLSEWCASRGILQCGGPHPTPYKGTLSPRTDGGIVYWVNGTTGRKRHS